jgi:hypothetical protein
LEKSLVDRSMAARLADCQLCRFGSRWRMAFFPPLLESAQPPDRLMLYAMARDGLGTLLYVAFMGHGCEMAHLATSRIGSDASQRRKSSSRMMVRRPTFRAFNFPDLISS